ncbi:hypothetical protein ACEPAF_5440 [Sanghuangporus sanghuang]
MPILTELPYDVIQLIASFLLPYDVLALSSTCSSLKSIKDERAIWLQVADSVSRSRPLPFRSFQALDLPLEIVIGACLRAERIAKSWAKPHIYPRRHPTKVIFPDRRIITYFTFLPGSRHVMVFDALNVLSCWTTDGKLLTSVHVQQGASLSRWKPCDEESSYGIQELGSDAQAVEITIELPVPLLPTRYRLILLVYTPTDARFEAISSFQIPSIFEPFSAVTQDELCGGLVRLNTEPERVGIFLINKNTEKSVCIDTGLCLVIQCVPQALPSSTQLVLYWEIASSAHAYSYDLDVLRDLLEREGRNREDPMIRIPIQIPPSDVSSVPFRTVNARTCCGGCGAHIECDLPSTDLSRNRHAYPIIIPKWHTLRENLRRHRTRSVLTFSRRASAHLHVQAHSLAMYVNAPHYDTLHIHLIDEDEELILPNVDANTNFVDPAPDLQGSDHHRRHGSRSAPRTTIAHHYFGTPGSSPGNKSREIVRTVLADAPLRRPQSLRVNQHHAHALVANDWHPEMDVGPMMAHAQHLAEYGNEIDQDEHGEEDNEDGITTDGFDFTDRDLGEGLFDVDDEDEEDEDEEENNEHDEYDDPYHHNDDFDSPVELLGDGVLEHDGLATLQHRLQGLHFNLGLEEQENHTQAPQNFTINPDPGHAAGPSHAHEHVHMHTDAPSQPHLVYHDHHRGSIWNLTPHAAQALADILQDPFGGSPVIGFGGRCAMWVEEHPSKHQHRADASEGRYERESVLRVATFPTYEPLEGDDSAAGPVHHDLEVSRGCVGTLHLPDYIPLESSYTFDLDDVRGLVGVATLFGELWLVDFS